MPNRGQHHTWLDGTCSCLSVDSGVPRQNQGEGMKLPSAQGWRQWLRKARLDTSGKMARFLERIWSLMVTNTGSGSSGVTYVPVVDAVFPRSGSSRVTFVPVDDAVFPRSGSSGVTFVPVDDGVFFEILGRLPLRSLAQCRAVCKEWHRAIDGIWKCGLASGSHVVHPKDTYWLAISRDYDIPTQFWFSWQDYVPARKLVVSNPFTIFPCFQSHGVERVVASSGALVLCELATYWETPERKWCLDANVSRTQIDGWKSANLSYLEMSAPHKLMVCNPLKSECFTILPPHVSGWPIHSFGIVHDEVKDTFKVIVLSQSLADVPNESQIEVYDSVTKRFEVVDTENFPFPKRGLMMYIDSINRGYIPNPHAIRGWRGVSYKRFVLFLAAFSSDYDFKIVVLDSEKHVWFFIKLPEETMNSQLEVHGDHLYLIGEKSNVGTATSRDVVKVWELQLASEVDLDHAGPWHCVSTLSQLQRWGRQTSESGLPQFFNATTLRRLGVKVDETSLLTFFRSPWDPVLLYNIDEDTWYEVEDVSQTRARVDLFAPIEAFKVTMRPEACVCR